MAENLANLSRFVAVNGPNKSNLTGTDVTALKYPALISTCQILILRGRFTRLPLVFGSSGLEVDLWDGNYHYVTGAGQRIPSWFGTQAFNKGIGFRFLSFN